MEHNNKLYSKKQKTSEQNWFHWFYLEALQADMLKIQKVLNEINNNGKE